MGSCTLNNTCPPGEIQLLVVILTMEDIKKAIGEAEKELEVAERLVASKRSALMVLQKQLQEQLVKNVGGLKGAISGGDKVNRNETEEERRARVRRRWRVLALKVKFASEPTCWPSRSGTSTTSALSSTKRLRKQRKKIRWTWRENACGKRQTNGTSGVVVYE